MAVDKFVQYIGLAVLIAPVSLWSAPACREAIAEIVSAQGQVNLNPYKTDAWLDISQQEPVCPGDTLRTLQQSRATLRLRNKAVITLDQNTTMTFSAPVENPASWFIQLLKGVTYFRSRQPQRLDVHTPFINAVHQGTEFLVAVDEKQAEISVFDGKVRGENPAGKVNIEKGYKGIAGANQAPRLEPLKIKPEDAVQWMLYYPPLVDDSSANATDAELNSALNAYRRGNFHDALSKLEQVPETRRTSRFYSVQAALLLTLGRADEAALIIERIKNFEPGNSDALALEAIIAVAKNRHQQAMALAEQAVAKNPASATARIAQSYAHQALFAIDEAAKAAAEATRLNPENALAWARLAELQFSQGERRAALQAAQKAQSLNPRLARTQTVLGFVNLAETEIAQAQQLFRKAIALDSSDPLARLGLGLAQIRQGEVEAGKTELETAVNLDPNNAVTRSYLGKAYYELRNKDYAGKEYELAKELDPKDPTPYFYDAILKQTTNRPVEALHDMQKAIELNDNRGVYRSKFLLDKDTAARQVGLGRIFNNLGFDDPANRQAMNSLAIDPGNYSAHRLLADSYLTKPRHEIARSSEHLQSQLLQPLNYNPIQPSLAYSDLNIIRGIGPSDISFNEYNRMYDRNGIRFTTTGLVGNNSTLGDETAIAGIVDNFSYSIGQMHYDTNGFRQNNDIKHNLYNAFAQYQISPDFNIQAEYRHRESEIGDLEFKGDITKLDDKIRRQLDQDTYRLGAKISPAQNSDVLMSFIHVNRDEDHNSATRITGNTKSYDFETQYLFHEGGLNVVAGAGLYTTENNAKIKFSIPQVYDFKQQYGWNTNQYFGYVYSNYNLFNNLTLTTGFSFDHYRDNGVYDITESTLGNSSGTGLKIEINEFNPKLGLLWKASDALSFRLAGFKVVKPAIANSFLLQPTQIAGFNQFFDDSNGTVSWQYGAGIDTHFHQDIYAGVEAYNRHLRMPSSRLNPEPHNKNLQPREELYRFYFNWAMSDNWVFNTELRFENYRSDENSVSLGALPKYIETAYVPTELRFFHPSGFFAALKGTYVDQCAQLIVLDNDNDNVVKNQFNSDFYLVDAAIGYRFPKQYGLVSLEAKNLFDTNFNYQDRQYQTNEYRSPDFLPERMVYGKLTLNF